MSVVSGVVTTIGPSVGCSHTEEYKVSNSGAPPLAAGGLLLAYAGVLVATAMVLDARRDL
jgi:hypothetical protein